MATRALGLFSRIHFASSTITMLLPLPCVCQMMPPFFSRACACAALTPKYWCARGSFFTPPSKSTKSCISSISRSLRHILSRYLSSLKRLSSASSSFHFRKYFSGVPMAPYCSPSESLPAKMSCTVLKNQALNSGCWFERLWRMPSPMLTRLFFSSSTPTAMPFTYSTMSGRRSWFPLSVTSSAMAKSFFSGSCQLMRWTVSVTLPASVFTGTP